MPYADQYIATFTVEHHDVDQKFGRVRGLLNRIRRQFERIARVVTRQTVGPTVTELQLKAPVASIELARGLAERAAEELEESVYRNVGVSSGRLVSSIGIAEPITASSWGAGPWRLLGDPNEPAPSGTIKEFMDDWRATHSTRTGRGRASLSAIGEASESGMGQSRPWPMAWHFLSREQKDELEARRLEGLYGGDPGGRPLYWYILEAGMERVGVPEHRYVEDALFRIRENLDVWKEEIMGGGLWE